VEEYLVLYFENKQKKDESRQNQLAIPLKPSNPLY
jgi:hypothetical protein